MKNSKILMASLFSVAALAVGASTFAYQGNPGVQKTDCTDLERQASVNEMFENEDYTAFQELYADKGITNKVTTQEAFLSFVALRNAQAAGDTATANEIASELGLGQRRQDGSGQGNGSGNWNGNGLRDGSGQGNGGNRQGRSNK